MPTPVLKANWIPEPNVDRYEIGVNGTNVVNTEDGSVSEAMVPVPNGTTLPYTITIIPRQGGVDPAPPSEVVIARIPAPPVQGFTVVFDHYQ